MSIFSTDQPKNFKITPIDWNHIGSGGSGSGDTNKIESVSQNGKKLPIDKNKNVNIITPVNISDLKDVNISNIKDKQIIVYDEETKQYVNVDNSTSSDKFTRNEAVKVTIGGVTAGNYNPYDKTTNQILEDVFYPYIQFTVDDLTCNINKLQEIGTTLTAITLQVKVTKKDKAIQTVKFYDGSTLIQTIDNQPNGGTYSYSYACNISTDTTFKVVITDGQKTIEKTLNISFVKKSYYGVISADNEITVDLIKSLNNQLIGKKDLTFKNINLINQRILYAYPSIFGNLTSILDDNGFEYLDSYVLNKLLINEVEYNVYVLETPISIDNALQIYK